MEGGSKSACSGNTKRVGYRPSHLLIRQELKPCEVLLGRIAAFLHASSLLCPVQGEDIRHTAKNTRAELLGQRKGSSLETGQEHV